MMNKPQAEIAAAALTTDCPTAAAAAPVSAKARFAGGLPEKQGLYDPSMNMTPAASVLLRI